MFIFLRLFWPFLIQKYFFATFVTTFGAKIQIIFMLIFLIFVTIFCAKIQIFFLVEYWDDFWRENSNIFSCWVLRLFERYLPTVFSSAVDVFGTSKREILTPLATQETFIFMTGYRKKVVLNAKPFCIWRANNLQP